MSHLPTLKICHFPGQRQQYNVFLQGNLLDPGLFDQLLLGSGHKVSVILGWMIVGWAMENATISLGLRKIAGKLCGAIEIFSKMDFIA